MKIYQLKYAICCEVPSCGRLARKMIYLDNEGKKTISLCTTCLKNLKTVLLEDKGGKDNGGKNKGGANNGEKTNG